MTPQRAEETWTVNTDILKGKHQATLEECTFILQGNCESEVLF